MASTSASVLRACSSWEAWMTGPSASWTHVSCSLLSRSHCSKWLRLYLHTESSLMANSHLQRWRTTTHWTLLCRKCELAINKLHLHMQSSLQRLNEWKFVSTAANRLDCNNKKTYNMQYHRPTMIIKRYIKWQIKCCRWSVYKAQDKMLQITKKIQDFLKFSVHTEQCSKFGESSNWLTISCECSCDFSKWCRYDASSKKSNH